MSKLPLRRLVSLFSFSIVLWNGVDLSIVDFRVYAFTFSYPLSFSRFLLCFVAGVTCSMCISECFIYKNTFPHSRFLLFCRWTLLLAGDVFMFLKGWCGAGVSMWMYCILMKLWHIVFAFSLFDLYSLDLHLIVCPVV